MQNSLKMILNKIWKCRTTYVHLQFILPLDKRYNNIDINQID